MKKTLQAKLKKPIPQFWLEKWEQVTVQHRIAWWDNLTLQTWLWQIINNETPNWRACAKDEDLEFIQDNGN